MKSFEEILKEGKDKAVSQAPANTPRRWRELVNLLMETLHSINDMYGTTDEHQIKVRASNCNGCSKASFIIAIRDITSRERIMKFHRGRWVAMDKDTYYCEKCKKGK
jgi:hypothetical protein